jgi:UDP-N-acetylmuramate--alanine ligase
MKPVGHIEKVYFLGIGGIGMSALARWLVMEGKSVAGYDKTETTLTKALSEEGMVITYVDEVSTIPQAYQGKDVLVVLTPAVPANSNQLQFFKNNGNLIMKRAELLGMISSQYFTIAVSGTHGKTTTSSMVAHILKHAGVNVAAFLGGITQNYNTNVLFPDFEKGNIVFVVEADEFDRSFLHLNPNVIIVNATDPDHLDIYGSEEAFKQSFNDFVAKLRDQGLLIERKGAGVQYPATAKQVLTFGEEGADVFVKKSWVEGNGEVKFELNTAQVYASIMPGMHNQNNATAAALACKEVGLTEAQVAEGISTFRGVKRRFEYHVKTPQLCYIDDYAHHPEEVKSFIKGARSVYPDKKLTVVFQPHLFSRTNDFMDEFAEVLSTVDELFLLDIYPARELPMPGVTSQVLLDKITIKNKHLVSKENLLKMLINNQVEILATLGAGDIDTLILHIKTICEEKVN